MNRNPYLLSVFAGVAALSMAGCGQDATQNQQSVTVAKAPSQAAVKQVIHAVGAENEYANVISQIGGKYVVVTAIMSNPNTDPHTFEASPQIAGVIANAGLIVQNGLGYDDFMSKLESATPDASRKVIDVQTVLGYANHTANPHLWYKPNTMNRVAKLIASDLEALNPSEKSYFAANLNTFEKSLQPWFTAIAKVKAEFPNAPVAVTEPVADYMLQATGMDIKTPWAFQSAVMNGTDPSPQDVQTEENLFKKHQVKVFLYNQQVVDPLTNSLLKLAKENDIPIVGVYETMPLKQDYQSWMVAEVKDLQNALANHASSAIMS